MNSIRFTVQIVALICLSMGLSTLSQAQGLKTIMVDSLLAISLESAKSDPVHSRTILDKVLNTLSINVDSIKLSAALNNYGLTYYYQGAIDSSILYYQKSLDIAVELNDSSRIAQRNRNIGLCYRIKGFYTTALEYYHAADVIYNKLGSKKELASINNSIGTIYYSLHDYRTSREYYQKALHIWQVENDSGRMSKALNNIGITFSGSKQYSEAKRYYRKSLDYNKNNDNPLQNLGEDYLKMDSLNHAENYLSRALVLRENRKSKNDMASTLTLLGELNRKRGNYQKAINYLAESYKLIGESGDVNRLFENQLVQKSLAADLKQFERALQLDRLIDSLNSKLFEEEQLKVLQLQADFNLKAKESERKLAEERAKIAELQSLGLKRMTQARLWIIIFLVLLVTIASFFSWKLYHKNKKMLLLNDSIKKQNITIHTLATEAHHKTKNSLQLLGSLMRFQSIRASDESTKTALNDAWSRLETINHVHQKLLSQNLKSDGLALTNAIDLREYLNGVLKGSFAVVNFHPYPEGPLFQLEGDNIELSMDTSWNLGLVVNELATNFIKHVLSVGKKLIVNIESHESYYQVTVSDNGPGYDFNKLNTGSFGMEMIKILIKDLEGKFVMTSSENGSQFKIEIPMKQTSK